MKSDKRVPLIASLFTLVISFLVVNSFGQNGQTTTCNESDCLINECVKLVANDCKGKGGECWIARYTEIIQSNPDDWAAYVGRGRAFWAKDPELAIQDLNKAIALNPSYFQTYISLGLLYCTVKKDCDRAIVEFNRAIELADQEGREAGYRRIFYLQNAYVNRGFAYLQKRDFDKALADYNKVIEMNPRSGSGYSGRGSVYTAQQDYDNAIADYNKAIELSPDDWFNYSVRGHLYVKQGEKAKGEADLQKSKELKKLEDRP